jgi:hypothetical protein
LPIATNQLCFQRRPSNKKGDGEKSVIGTDLQRARQGLKLGEYLNANSPLVSGMGSGLLNIIVRAVGF